MSNIALVVYSQTNNTLSVAERLATALREGGHSVSLLKVSAVMEGGKPKLPVVLQDKPDISGYDTVVFGAPVQGFALAPVMKAYMASLGSLSGKKAACFVTQHFKKAWKGGNQAIRTMTGHVSRLGGTLALTAVVNWSSEKREEQISSLIRSLARVGAGES